MKKIIACMLWLIAQHAFSGPLLAQTDSMPCRVTGVTSLTPGHENQLRLGEYIRVEVSSLDRVLAQRGTPSQIILFVNGIPMSGIKAGYCDSCDHAVFFHMVRSDGTDPWDVFYLTPFAWVRRDMVVSIGYETGCALPSSTRMDLVIIYKRYFFIALALVIGILVLFWYGLKRGLLSDDCALPASAKPYSLSRTQLAAWSVVISICYIFIALVTGELIPLSASTLVLLGLSGATAFAGNIIDTNDKSNNLLRHQDQSGSEGFLNDILSDANGISVHRFQMVVFNILLMVFFVRQVFTSLQMPEFDNNLLVLIGVSNATYAGLKINENKNPASPANADNAPANPQ